MQDEFELETVLSVVTGMNYTDDFGKVYELFGFMFEDPLISPTAILVLKDTAVRHILSIHPELNNIVFNVNQDLNSWINEQKARFGEYLTISVVGEPIINLSKKTYQSNR